MRFKKNTEIFFSILYDSSSDTKSSAAIAADVYKDELFFFVSNSDQIVTEISDYLDSTLSFKSSFLVLDSRWILDIIPFFADDIFSCDNVKTEVLLDDNLTEKRTTSSEKIIKAVIKKRNSTLQINDIDIENPMIRNEISKHLRALTLVEKCITQYYIGDSALPPSSNISNRTKTDFEGLKLIEYTTAISNIGNIKQNNHIRIKNYINKKINTLNKFTPLIPVIPDDITNKSRPSNALHDGYPTIYKLLSCFQYQAAILSIANNNANSAFLHSIRCIETYIDGFLLHESIATINDYYNRRGLLAERDSFLINNKRINGFGKKFEFAGGVNNIKNHQSYAKIREMMDIRNKLYLTHGDMKACSLLTKISLKHVHVLINYIDNISNQTSLPWHVIHKQINKSVQIDFYGAIKSALADSYIHDFTFRFSKS